MTFCAKKTQPEFQAKIPLTEVEQRFDKVLLELHRVESNITTQKQNLRDMYSAKDRSDYKELLKTKRGLTAQLKRIAKKESKQDYEIEFEIAAKKQYNRFAPKIIRAQTKEELKQAVDLIMSYSLFQKVKVMLEQIISQKVFK